MLMIEKYFKNLNEYNDKFGKKIFLLYQVGAFYELYATKNINMENMKEYSEICGLAIAEKTKSTYLKEPLFMSGFKDYFLEKYIEKIHPHGYTIIVYNQKDKGELEFVMNMKYIHQELLLVKIMKICLIIHVVFGYRK